MVAEFLEQDEITETETFEILSLPPFMRRSQQSPTDDWAGHWEDMPVRRESKMLARDYVGNGFTDSGWPTHPRVVSAISEDTGRSTATIKRFHKKSADLGMLTEVGSHVFHVGMRATPMFALTAPVEPPAPPAGFGDDIDAQVWLSTGAKAWGTGWQNKSPSPPDWAKGC